MPMDYVPSRQPMTSSGSPGKLSPAPYRTKSYSIPDHAPGSLGTIRVATSALSYWKPFQSGDLNPWVSYGATADRPRPKRRDSTKNRPWNERSFVAYTFTYQRWTSRR